MIVNAVNIKPMPVTGEGYTPPGPNCFPIKLPNLNNPWFRLPICLAAVHIYIYIYMLEAWSGCWCLGEDGCNARIVWCMALKEITLRAHACVPLPFEQDKLLSTLTWKQLSYSIVTDSTTRACSRPLPTKQELNPLMSSNSAPNCLVKITLC